MKGYIGCLRELRIFIFILLSLSVFHHLSPPCTCGFPLAEERKRRKTFFSHMTGSLGSSVWGVSGHVRRSCSLCDCYPPLPDTPHPPIPEYFLGS